MSPIQYIEARCDICNDEIYSEFQGVEFGILRSGKLVCATCRDQRPDHEHFKNFSVAPIPETEEEPELIPEDDKPEKETEDIE